MSGHLIRRREKLFRGLMIYLSICSDNMFCCTSAINLVDTIYILEFLIEFYVSSQQQLSFCPDSILPTLADWVIMVCLFVFLFLVCNLFVIIHCSVPPPGPWAAAVRLSTMMMGWCEHSYLSLINTEESLIIQINNYSVRLSREWSGPHSPSTPGLCWESLQRMAGTSHVRWEEKTRLAVDRDKPCLLNLFVIV